MYIIQIILVISYSIIFFVFPFVLQFKYDEILRFLLQSTLRLRLTDADHEDLVSIIEKVLPHAPQFKLLLEGQLRNSKAKDPRHRRWHPDMISLCTNLWAKYVIMIS